MTLSTAENLLPEDVSPAHLLYGMMSAFALALVPVLLALIINLTQKGRGVVMKSHLKWQRWSMLGFFTTASLAWVMPQFWMCLSIFSLGMIWFVHRIIKGWLCLADGVAIP